jgi:hypothetical protein
MNEIQKPFEILPKATGSFVSELKIRNIDLRETVILCDIEGFENEIFDFDTLSQLADCVVIVELHESVYGLDELDKLIASFEAFFSIRIIQTGSRNLDDIPEIQHLPDHLRWSLCSEGRRKSMKWLIAEPIV